LLRGFTDEAWKVELAQIEQRRVVLTAEIAAADAEPPPPALHPSMAALYRQKVTAVAAALDHPDEGAREEARDTLRGFIAAIVIPPEGLLPVRGDLGAMLTVAGGDAMGAALRTVASVGCGGSQPTLSAAVAPGGLRFDCGPASRPERRHVCSWRSDAANS
jgi:site-specific DNA recombinase